MTKDIYVVGAVIVKDGRILCAKRGSKKTLANYWEFPGGKIERNETAEEALKRELKEELLVELSKEMLRFSSNTHDYEFGRVHLTTFVCHIESGNPVLTEHSRIKWLKPNELLKLKWAPADLPIVEQLSKMILK